MGRLGQITLEDVVAGLLRYRPAVVTVAAILAVVFLLPGGPGDAEQEAAPPGPRGGQNAVTTTSTTSPPATSAPAPTPAPPATGGASPSPTFRSPTTSPPPSQGGTGTTFSPPTTRSSFGDEAEPLSIVATAWASATAGTPLGAEGVPEGTLPVGTRLGQDDKRSFIRLDGDGISLRLREDPEGRRDPARGEAAVRLCQVTEAGWEEAEAQSFEEAPEYRDDTCVDGTMDGNDVWTFSLATFPSATDDRGFALVPGQGAPIDFQVAFEPVALPA